MTITGKPLWQIEYERFMAEQVERLRRQREAEGRKPSSAPTNDVGSAEPTS